MGEKEIKWKNSVHLTGRFDAWLGALLRVSMVKARVKEWLGAMLALTVIEVGKSLDL